MYFFFISSFLRILNLSFIIQSCYSAENNTEGDDFDQPASGSNGLFEDQVQQMNLDIGNDLTPSTSYNDHYHENNRAINGSFQIIHSPDQYTKMFINVPIPRFFSSFKKHYKIFRRIIQCGGCHSLVIGKIIYISSSPLFIIDTQMFIWPQRSVALPMGLMQWDTFSSASTRDCPKCYKTLDIRTNRINDGIVYQRCTVCEELKDMWSCKFYLAKKYLEAICFDCYKKRFYNGRTLRHQIEIFCNPVESSNH